jgi:glutathione peroxidase
MASSQHRGFGLKEQLEETIYGFAALLLDGQTVNLESWRGKVLLIVNTASKCGFTPQYAGLEELYRTYKQRGFAVLGFPCNQFGRQEPGSADEIGAFCEKNYGVSFPMFAKIDVNGEDAHPLYRYLKQRQPGLFGLLGGGKIRWNFTKFLIDRRGTVVGRYAPSKAPRALAARIENLLDSRSSDPISLLNGCGEKADIDQHGQPDEERD